MKRSPLAVAAAVIALGMTVSLAACEGQIPTVSAPTESASANPDLTEDQEQEMREALLKTIEDCNEQKNPANLGQAMSGPELEIRTSELQVAQKTGKLDPKTTIPTDITQTVIPTDNGWPRSCSRSPRPPKTSSRSACLSSRRATRAKTTNCGAWPACSKAWRCPSSPCRASARRWGTPPTRTW